MRIRLVMLSLLLLVVLGGCALLPGGPGAARDPHSYANTDDFRVRHLALDLRADFEQRVLSGTAELSFERRDPGADVLVLDTRDLEIREVAAAAAEGPWTPAAFELGTPDAVRGQALRIALPPGAGRVRIAYSTRPQASGLQWLTPEQTAGKQRPFLFTQSQAIHARSWIPLQDTPQVRLTYEARIHAPRGLRAVMAAEMLGAGEGGVHRFAMHQAIPSYLIALAIGDLRHAALGPRTGVWAEPSLVARAAREFADTEKMLAVCEKLYGPYRWGRYELLILPPSFPYGGMENPRLTFTSPSILAGDKSLVALVAHELAHSWSGNLVTNATWDDFWLNEGTTTYLTYRIMDAVYGTRRGDMERVLSWNDLQEALPQAARPGDRALKVDLDGRDPDELTGTIPYVRGERFLTDLEQRVGRERFDAFLRAWFEEHAFRSATTADFERFLRERLPEAPAGLVREWIHSPELPAQAPVPHSDAFDQVDALREAWLARTLPTSRLPARRFSVHEWRRFLDPLPDGLGSRMAELDRRFALSESKNSFIARSWLRLAIRQGYRPAFPALERYLTSIGRVRMIRPLYQELARTPSGREFALKVYAKARPGYHPIAQVALDRLLAPAAAN